MTIKRLIGTDPDQIPRNSDLGSMAFQDAAGVTVGKLKVNTSATLLGSNTGIAAGTVPLTITDGSTLASGITSSDYLVLAGQGAGLGVLGIVAGSSSGYRTLYRGIRAAGTLASPTAPAVNDEVVSLGGLIYDGAANQATAQITFRVDSSVSSGVAPQRIEFQTGDTNSRTTRLTIGSTGTITAASSVVMNAGGVVSVSSSTDAFRITQTGTGNALVVEDEANPDSTPFVIDTNGKVLIGSATSQSYPGAAPALQVNATSASNSTLGISRWVAGATAGGMYLAKSRGATVGSYSAVSANDDLGYIYWAGDDGAAFKVAAQISASVDGTPGTDDMPGRLLFSTTADGASSPTERMRITSGGDVGIAATTLGGMNGSFRVAKTLTGSTIMSAIRADGIIQSDATSEVRYFISNAATAAASFTLTTLNHYLATQTALGSGSAITSQVGFRVDSSLAGATNNYGFYSTLATGTGGKTNYNFYANGTAPNYFAGNTGIGATPSGSYTLEVTGDARISGNLTVDGTTTTINSTTISVDDINIELGSVATPTDTTANGGGITLRGSTDKTIVWGQTNANWTSSEHWNIAVGKSYRIGTTDVLSATTLGSGVIASSLQSVGTLSGLTVNGSIVTGNTSGVRLRIVDSGSDMYIQSGNGTSGTGSIIAFAKYTSTNSTVKIDTANNKVSIGSNVGSPNATLDVQGDVIVKDSRVDTASTSVSDTTQTAVATFASATYRTAEFLVQIVDSTASSYHSAKVLVIHDGTTVNMVQYGVVHTANELGAFDADISGGNVRLLFTATAATTKTVKVLATMLTA